MSPILLLLMLLTLVKPEFSIYEEEAVSYFDDTKQAQLDYISEITTKPDLCSEGEKGFRSVAVSLNTDRFFTARQKAELVARFLQDSLTLENKHLMTTLLRNFLQSEPQVFSAKVLAVPENGGFRFPKYFVNAHRHNGHIHHRPEESTILPEVPWWAEDETEKQRKFMNSSANETLWCNWTYPYFHCEYQKWMISFVCPIYHDIKGRMRRNSSLLAGLFIIDLDVSHLDVNQCDKLSVDENQTAPYLDSQIHNFLGSNKCDVNSTKCIFTPGEGWRKGSYLCQCKNGFYSNSGTTVFNGTQVELAFSTSKETYNLLYVCRKCAPGCETCTDRTSCLSDYNWPFRIALLTVSMLCIVLTLLLMGYVYHYRKLKVIKVSSPIFLCITLLGAVIMYLEMAAIFPVLDMYSCIVTKWTRHLGFCITYSALLLKTWRVSLTYRVKSAHKIKLTDKQLLQWLFPILLVMVIYLSTWTVSSPPQGIYIKDYHGLKFKQCSYDWWDHSLAIGEVLFLLWGIKICYNVRNAESFFNEAKHITWAVYNIAVVNTIMVSIHLLIYPNAPPDIKYLFGFIRTQFSTTVTIILVFGPKFYRVLKGQGDVYDNRARARGVTASFSLNGIGLMHEETPDLYQENEELKEEIQKLAAQIEFMKIVHMEVNNRHIKPRQGGYFSQNAVNSTQSPVAKAFYMKFESSDSPTSRISPAAELISERV